jgi:hypothetical protein
MPPFVDRYGKPLTGTSRMASVEKDQDAKLDPNLIRHMNGFVRSVNDQEDKEDLNSA